MKTRGGWLIGQSSECERTVEPGTCIPRKEPNVKNFLFDETGQDLVEYALLLVFLAIAAIAILPLLGRAVNNVFSRSASTLTMGS
jgi:Flp pilus assembly pilin Flp